MTELDEQTRAELASWDPMVLWDLADMHISFRDDADEEVLSNFGRRQRIAQELTRYWEYRDKRPAPRAFAFPEGGRWVMGLGRHPAELWLNEQHPGIGAYFQWHGEAPPSYIWFHVERAGLWGMLEQTLLRFMNQGVVVPKWRWLERALLIRSVQQHLGVAPDSEDLMDLIEAERAKEEQDPIDRLNRGILKAIGAAH
jgi:hypothetical protein